ncbi:MAG TPA: hypothetical protein VHE09_03270 [Rhizomicrobium sp.]|nr:hypothetical protein [Rhizomicrobium sp.]
MRSSRITALATIATALLSTSALAMHHSPLPKNPNSWRYDPSRPVYHAPKANASGTWSMLTNSFPGSGGPDTALLLTDGTVMMHDLCTVNWFKLTPDNTGSYKNGTWSKMGAMPSGYSPLYFGSAVMPDGKHVMVEGGEYLNCSPVWTNKGAIYNRDTDSWTNVTPPSGWTKIGDAQSVVRTDGQYMQADCCTTGSAIATISGENVTWTATGTGKGDVFDEEGWTQLPDGTILSVDANRDLGTNNDYEIYSENTGAWTTPGKIGFSCTDPGSHEIGPAPMLPSGKMLQICGTAHTGLYDPLTTTWTQGPDMPNIDGSLDSADGPAAVLPSGNVLAAVSPGVFNNPTHFVEIKLTKKGKLKISQVDEPASASSQSSWESRMLVLPTGEVLWSSDVGDVEIYTPVGKPVAAAKPKVKNVSTTLTRGSTSNNISGKGFNGVSYGGYYGDDVQTSSNYPLVRFINNSTSHVCYAKTYNYATGLSDGSVTTAKFDIPNSCESGASKLEVVVNGVASKAKDVTLN